MMRSRLSEMGGHLVQLLTYEQSDLAPDGALLPA